MDNNELEQIVCADIEYSCYKDEYDKAGSYQCECKNVCNYQGEYEHAGRYQDEYPSEGNVSNKKRYLKKALEYLENKIPDIFSRPPNPLIRLCLEIFEPTPSLILLNNENLLFKNFIENSLGEQIIKLKKAEEGFNKKLLEQYRDNRPKN